MRIVSSRGRRLALLSPALGVALLSPAPARASGIDAATAREQLKQGYALKKDGKCGEAMPHLLESERLDPQAKTLLNLAECEETLGHLVDADVHLVEARDRAHTEARAELETIARQRLALLEKRIPHLTLLLASGAPVSTQVYRDGSMLGGASLGLALPVDPGDHVVLAKAEGFGARRITVAMKEREARTVTVSPLEGGSASTDPAVTETKVDANGEVIGAASADAPVAAASSSPSHVPAFVAFGVGVAGVAVGTIFGVRSFSEWSDAKSKCGASCAAGSPGPSALSTAWTSATVSDIGFVAGGVGVAAGIVLLVLESRGDRASAPVKSGPPATGLNALTLDPRIGPSGASLALGGRF